MSRDQTPGATNASPLGLDALWGHPLLGSMLRGQQHRRDLDRRRPWVLDTVVVLAVFAISLPDLVSSKGHGPLGETGNHQSLPTVLLWLFAVGLIAPLWWRRKAPTAVFFVILGVSLAEWSLGVWQAACGSALIALYSLAVDGSLRVLGWAAALTVAGLTLAVFALVPIQQPVLGLFFLLGTTLGAIATGLTLRIRRLYVQALEDRARQLEIERDQRVRLTAAAERARVAREMHDIVGHNLSVMVSLANGAETLAVHRGEQSAEALRLLGDTGRQAMGELRRVLGVLREEQDPERLLAPQPGIADLDQLLARVRAAGLPVTYRTVGDLDALGSGAQLTAFRIVQEALTNTLKHAGTASAAEVTLAAEPGRLRIRITDTGPPPDAPPTVPQTSARNGEDRGHGLVGIRQRAAMYGGDVTMGPRPDRPGWLVEVVLHTATAAPTHQDAEESPR